MFFVRHMPKLCVTISGVSQPGISFEFAGGKSLSFL